MVSSPRILVIAGMHRSGTSLLASAAVAAGVDMGAELMAGGKGNRLGHFEDEDFVRFHEGCLARRGASSLHPPAPAVCELSAMERRLAEELVERRAAKAAWGWKDPRGTLFLPYWERTLDGACFLLVYRHPVEVALSLLRRGLDLEVRLDPRQAIRAWTTYNGQLLDFHARRPESCLLWGLAGATRDFAAALALLARRTGLPFAGGELDRLYRPAELGDGLAAREIEWQAVVPETMQLYRRLEAAADLPCGSPRADDGHLRAATRREQETQEASEYLLAAALGAPPGGAAGAIPPAHRIQYSEMKSLIAWQAERIAALADRQAEQDAALPARLERVVAVRRGWDRVETTRAYRAIRVYWREAVRLRGWRRQAGWRLRRALGMAPAPPPSEIVVGCVAENDPSFLAQAHRLVRSLRCFGGSLAGARMLVCVVGSIGAAERLKLEREGAEVRIVHRFDPRNRPANKLQFFTEGLATGAGGLLLLDCDTVVVADPWPLLAGGAVVAKIADVASVTHDVFVRLFEHFGLPLPRRRYRTTLRGEPTIAYCNTGFVFLPAALAHGLVPAWREWNRRLLDALDLLGPCAHHCHQASLSLALAARPTPFAAASPALNFPLHMTHLSDAAALRAIDPVILHYHERVDDRGRLLPTAYPRAQARIDALNRRLQETSCLEAPLLAR